MTPEETKELKELIEFLKENKIGEFDLERGDLKVRIKFAQEGADMSQLLAALRSAQPHAAAPSVLPEVFATAAHVAPMHVAAGHAAAPAAAAGEAGEDAGLHVVKSPIVGTFYESPSPGAAPFVKIGDQVENGQILCIVEAMKLMNEIESDASGEIVKRFVQSGQPVEYGQALFAVRPR
jgi:acetyl-CoA carboxylase biotin carboxyl carrier protein